MTTFACEAENGVITCAFSNGEDVVPHVALSLSHQGSGDDSIVVVSRLRPDDARLLANSLAAAADVVAPKFDAYVAEVESDASLGA